MDKKLFALLSGCLLSGIAEAGQTKPNVIIIYTDDHGTLDANCFGAPDLCTPNIDALATYGVRFTQFYAAPVSSASRACLLTGQYAKRTGLTGNAGWTGLRPEKETIAERIKNGVTTVFDSHASYFEPTGSLGSIASAVRDCGIRACLCYETSDRDGNEKSELAISENLNFYDSISAMNIPTIRAMFGLHSSFTLSDATLRKCVVRNKGRTGFHISVSESPDDLYDSTQKYGCRPVQRLQNAGVLTPDSLLAHCTYVDDVGLDIIRRSGSSIVNCPESDLFNSTGCCPVFKILEKGITLGIGSDSYAADMLEVAKMSLSELRHTAGLPNAGFPEVARILFDGNAKIASRTFGIPIGRIQKGAAADIIIMDYIPYTPLSAVNTDRHIIFGMSGHECVMTMAAGRVLMRNRRLTFAREDILSRKTTAAAEDLWQSVNQDAQNRLLHDE